MDPNANILRQRTLAQRIQAIAEKGDDTTQADLVHIGEYASELADLVQALDNWCHHGGFLPDSWEEARKRVVRGRGPVKSPF